MARELIAKQQYAEAVRCLDAVLEAPEDFFLLDGKSDSSSGLKAEHSGCLAPCLAPDANCTSCNMVPVQGRCFWPPPQPGMRKDWRRFRGGTSTPKLVMRRRSSWGFSIWTMLVLWRASGVAATCRGRRSGQAI